ncbi:MAG: hypothetical protein AB7U64_11830 [Blastocatellales bacterium]
MVTNLTTFQNECILTGNWKLETGNWKLETGNLKTGNLKTGNSKTGNSKSHDKKVSQFALVRAAGQGRVHTSELDEEPGVSGGPV